MSPQDLEQQIAECERCIDQFPNITFTKPSSIYRGPYSATMMVIGEEPGASEVENRVAFSGPAGQVLRHWLEQAGFRRDRLADQVYFTSLLKCNTRGKLKDAMIGNCIRFLETQVAIVKPSVIVPLGSLCNRVLLGHKGSLTEIVGNSYSEGDLNKTLFRRFSAEIVFVPLPHPSPISAWYKIHTDLLEKGIQLLKNTMEGMI